MASIKVRLAGTPTETAAQAANGNAPWLWHAPKRAPTTREVIASLNGFNGTPTGNPPGSRADIREPEMGERGRLIATISVRFPQLYLLPKAVCLFAGSVLFLERDVTRYADAQ